MRLLWQAATKYNIEVFLDPFFGDAFSEVSNWKDLNMPDIAVCFLQKLLDDWVAARIGISILGHMISEKDLNTIASTSSDDSKNNRTAVAQIWDILIDYTKDNPPQENMRLLQLDNPLVREYTKDMLLLKSKSIFSPYLEIIRDRSQSNAYLDETEKNLAKTLEAPFGHLSGQTVITVLSEVDSTLLCILRCLLETLPKDLLQLPLSELFEWGLQRLHENGEREIHEFYSDIPPKALQ